MKKMYRNLSSILSFNFGLTLLIITALGTKLNAQQQAALYGFMETTEVYTPVTGTNSTATGDDGSQNTITIPFTFKFEGVTYTNLSINTNGFIRLGNTIAASPWTNTLSNTSAQRPLIAPFWDDNHRNTGSIQYAVTGVSPNQILEIGWDNINIGGGGSTSATLFASYKIRLYETTDVIEFIYGPTMANAGTLSASVGINGTATFLSVSPSATSTVSSATANNAISSTVDLVGKKFIFTPPAPPSCPTPSALNISALTLTTASLGWTENGTATSWNVEWGVTGFTQGTGTMVTGTTNNPEPITGLSASTTYQFYVQADCGGSGTSTWAGPFSFFTGYCTPAPSSVDGLGITNVTVGTINNTTAAEVGNYGNYSSQVTNIAQNTNVTVNITYSTGYTYDTKIWIDWNDDLDFNDVGEEVYVGTSLAANPTTLVANFTVPLTAPLGNHRMRIGGQDAGPATPCYTGTYGTFEDYTVNVTLPPSCLAPSVLTATSITANSASLGWTENGTSTTWNVEWGVTGFTQGTGTMVTGTTNNPEPISGLSPSTTYQFYVQADCGGSGTSTWAGPFSFTTPCLPPVISSFPWTENFDGVSTPAMPCGWMVDNVNADAYTWLTGTTANSAPNSMQIRWNTAAAANDWSFTPELVLVGGQTYELSFAFAVAGATFPEKLKVMVGSAQNVAGMSDLLFDSTLTNTVFDTAFTTFTPTVSGSYFIGFHNYSDADMFRVYVDDVTLKEVIADTCSMPSNLSASSITQTSAMLDWTENGTATEWDIEWGFQGFTLGTGIAAHVLSKPHLLNGLSPATAYEFYVRADCGSGDTSLWVGPFMFVTDPCPFVIIDLGNDTTLCSNQSITLTAPFNPNWGYNWIPVGSGGPISVLDTAVLGGNGTYNVLLNVIDFTNGCSYFDAINVTFDACTGIGENKSLDFAVYPNPTNGILTIRANEKGTIEITNLQGKVVYKNSLNSTSQVINLSENAKGVYFVSITTSKGVEVQKIVIQ